jgi:hypothetical protein
MSKPETLKDVIEETMRVSGVPYKVPVGGGVDVDPVREKQFGGDHYKRMGIQPWDVVDTWPLGAKDRLLPGRGFEIHHADGIEGSRPPRDRKGQTLHGKTSGGS